MGGDFLRGSWGPLYHLWYRYIWGWDIWMRGGWDGCDGGYGWVVAYVWGAMMWDADRDRGYGIVFEMGM